MLVLPIGAYAQIENVGIGTNSPNASAKLEISSVNQGFLMPRLSSLQRIGIIAPAEGLMVYDTNTVSFWYFNGGNWQELISEPPAPISNILFSSMDQIGIATSSETVIGTFALPANTLSANGKAIEINAFGHTTADTSMLRFKFGPNVITFPIGVFGNWTAQVRVYRKSLTEIKMTGTLTINNFSVADVVEGFQDLSLFAPIQITASQGDATINGVSMEGFSIEMIQ